MSMDDPYVTIQDIVNGRVTIAPVQWNRFKSLLTKGMRSPQRISAISNMSVHDVVRVYPKVAHWSYPRFAFHQSGKVQYIAGQDEDYEMREIRKHFLKLMGVR